MDEKARVKLEKLRELTQGDFKAFLYDCDGTLADNVASHKAAFVKVAAEFNIDLDPSLIDELAGIPTIIIAEEIIKRYDADFDPTHFATRKSTVFVDEFLEKTLPVYFVVEHLKENVGKTRIAVVSGGKRSTVSKTLHVIGVDKYLDALVCAGETRRGKPHPDPFLKAAELLGVNPEECLVFEDGLAGCKGAEKAGMKWIRVDKITSK